MWKGVGGAKGVSLDEGGFWGVRGLLRGGVALVIEVGRVGYKE